jgi:hypothetical protein
MMGYNQSETHMTNEQLYEKTKQRPISKEIQRRQLKFNGHCIRINVDQPANTYVFYASNPNSASARRKGVHSRTKSAIT